MTATESKSKATIISTSTKHFTLIGVALIALALTVGLTINLQTTFAQEASAPTTNVDNLLTSVGTTLAAISTLISVVVGIIVYIVNAIKSKTGDKIVSTDSYNRFLDVVAQVRQKDNELRDAYRQVLEQREVINVTLDVLKNTSPEVGKKIDETLPKVNEAVQTKILPQINEWQVQADNFYDTLLKKSPVGTKI